LYHLTLSLCVLLPSSLSNNYDEFGLLTIAEEAKVFENSCCK